MVTTINQLPKLQRKVLEAFSNEKQYTSCKQPRRLSRGAESWHIVGQAFCSLCRLDGKSQLADVRNTLEIQCYICQAKCKPIFCSTEEFAKLPATTRRLVKLFARETETGFQSSPGTWGSKRTPALALVSLSNSSSNGSIELKDTVQQAIQTGVTYSYGDFWPKNRWEPVLLHTEIRYSLHDTKQPDPDQPEAPVYSDDGFYKSIKSPHYLFEGAVVQLSELGFQLTRREWSRYSDDSRSAGFVYERQTELSEATDDGKRYLLETVILQAKAKTL